MMTASTHQRRCSQTASLRGNSLARSTSRISGKAHVVCQLLVINLIAIATTVRDRTQLADVGQ